MSNQDRRLISGQVELCHTRSSLRTGVARMLTFDVLMRRSATSARECKPASPLRGLPARQAPVWFVVIMIVRNGYSWELASHGTRLPVSGLIHRSPRRVQDNAALGLFSGAASRHGAAFVAHHISSVGDNARDQQQRHRCTRARSATFLSQAEAKHLNSV